MRRAELHYHLGRNYRSKRGDQKIDEVRNYFDEMLLKLSKDDLKKENIAEKLLIMITWLLYQERMGK